MGSPWLANVRFKPERCAGIYLPGRVRKNPWLRLPHDALFAPPASPQNARSPCVPAWASGGAAPAHLAGANGLRRIEGIAR